MVLGAFGTVVAEAVGDSSTQLPRSVDDAVGRLVLEHLDVRTVEPPSIVDDDLRVAVARGVDQPLAAPVLRAMSPVAITPQVLRPEAFDEIEHVGMQHLVDVLVARVALVAPVEQGVVRAEHEPGSFAGRRVLGQHVAARAVVQHGAIGARSVPPAQSVVVLGDEDRVAHAGSASELGPGVRFEAFEREQRPEVVEPFDVRPAVAVMGEHLDQRRRVQDHIWHRIAEVAAVPVGVLPDRRPGRHSRQVGVDEHAVATLLPPRRHCHERRSWHLTARRGNRRTSDPLRRTSRRPDVGPSA